MKRNIAGYATPPSHSPDKTNTKLLYQKSKNFGTTNGPNSRVSCCLHTVLYSVKSNQLEFSRLIKSLVEVKDI